MFVLRTGLQGNGKTLNTIKEVDQKAFAEGRKVYYCNVTGFKPDHPAIKAEWIQFDTPEKWFELPANAMIVIDEAQTWFRVRPQGSKVPDYASRLEIMRKDGHELHCITQSPKLIDAHMRELCNSHIHYHRGNGGQVIKRWVFQKPELTVNSNKLEFENGESSRITVDKSYFGCYESVKEGTGHHFKFRPPKAMLVFGVCVILLLAGVGKLYYSRYAKHEKPAEPAAEQSAPNASPAAPGRATAETHLSTEQFIDERIPRIPDVPSSAPMYDAITVSVQPSHLPQSRIKGDGVRVFLSGRDSPYRRDFHAPTKLLPQTVQGPGCSGVPATWCDPLQRGHTPWHQRQRHSQVATALSGSTASGVAGVRSCEGYAQTTS